MSNISGLGHFSAIPDDGAVDDAAAVAPAQEAAPPAGAGAAQPGDWAGLQSYLDATTGTRTTQGNSVQLLVDGKQAFPAFLAAIDGAKDSINLETYNYYGDKTGNEVADHLIAAAKRGVTVNVLMDAVGSDRHGGHEVAERLRAAGVNVIEGKMGLLQSGKIDHRKVMTIDGTTGFTGGMNIGDDWQYRWHDMHTKIQGPAVADLQKSFLARWKTEGGQVPSKPNYFPPPAPAGNQAIRVLPHTGGKDENIRDTYVRAIDTAQSQILVEDPYFNDPEILSHLEAAARRGVDVRCVWPAQNNVKLEEASARARYPELLAAGVKIYEYQPSMAHEKVCAIDGKFATIGSSNLDARSLDKNDELNIVSLDPALAGSLTAAIQADIGRSKQVAHANNGLVGKFLDNAIVDRFL